MNKTKYIFCSVLKRDDSLAHRVERWFKFYIFAVCRVEADVATTVLGKICSSKCLNSQLGPKSRSNQNTLLVREETLASKTNHLNRDVCTCVGSFIALGLPQPSPSLCHLPAISVIRKCGMLSRNQPKPPHCCFCPCNSFLSSKSQASNRSLYIQRQNIPELSTAKIDLGIGQLKVNMG